MSLWSCMHTPGLLLSRLCMGRLWWWLYSVTGHKAGVPSCAQWKDNGQLKCCHKESSIMTWEKSRSHGGSRALETEPEMWSLNPRWTSSVQGPGSRYLPWNYPCVKNVLTRWSPHIIFRQFFFFLMIRLQSLVPIPYTKVHSGSLDDRSHVFTTRWLRSAFMFLSEN